MLRPFLLVGVGGSGGKTLRTLRDDLTQRLREVGWTEDFPRAWQMLQVDVPTNPDGDDPGLPAQLPTEQYAGLVAPGLQYRNLDHALVNMATPAALDGLMGWRPDPAEVHVPIDLGAGQFRALGRLITIANLHQLRRGLDQAFARLQSPEVASEMERLSAMFGVRMGVDTIKPVVVVISSLAGGSGSGAFMDVADVIRAVAPPQLTAQADASFGVLYAPDVFDEITEAARKGVRPNALAALAEQMAGYWNGEGPDDRLTALYGTAAIANWRSQRLGIRFPMIVGRRNSDIAFGTQNEVYQAVGRALGAWLTDGTVQDQVLAYAMANWNQAAPAVTDTSPLKTSGEEAPFSAMGFARLSLGRDRFRRYAAQRLASGAVDRILRGHQLLAVDGEEVSDEELVRRGVEQQFLRFHSQAGLCERGEQSNQILDGLRPRDLPERLRSEHTRLMRDLTAPEAGDKVKASEWAARIRVRRDELEPSFVGQIRGAVNQAAQGWVVQAQERLADETAAVVSQFGYRVAAGLLERLVEELADVSVELARERAKNEGFVRTRDGEITAALGTPNDVVPAANPAIEQAVRWAVDAWRFRTEVIIREVAVDLMRDFAEGVVRPMARAVQDAGRLLALKESESVGGRVPLVKTWASGPEVPRLLQPSVNEILIEDTDTFDTAFRGRLTATLDMPGERDRGALRQAIADVVSGITRGQKPEQSLVVRELDWVPQHSDYHPSGAVPSQASFRLDVRPETILVRADAWVSDPETAIGRFCGTTINEYLTAEKLTQAERSQRLTVLLGSLRAVLRTARPLVSLNAAALSSVHHENAPQFTTVISGLPFRDGSEPYQETRQVLVTAGIEDPEKWFTDHDSAHVDVFTMLARPYQPMVIESLMRPIADEVAALNSSDDRAFFWRWRRARPLPEALPISRRARRAMIRGWFTSALLNQVRRANGQPMGLFVPDATGTPGRMVSFPHPLITPPSGAGHDVLPAVLEGILLAMLEVSRTGRLDSFAPYARLKELGTAGDGGTETYLTPNHELRAWILDGQLPAGAPEPDPNRAGRPTDPAASRRDLSVITLELIGENMDKHFASIHPGNGDVTRAWELRDDIRSVLADLTRVVAGLDTDGEFFG